MRNPQGDEFAGLGVVALALGERDELGFGEDHSLLALDRAHDDGLLVGHPVALSRFRQGHDFRVAGRGMAVPFFSADHCGHIFSPKHPVGANGAVRGSPEPETWRRIRN
jgi:hypothetical protein